ncbi:dihydrofolate reductase-like [Lissotriton helveticus]
MSKNTEQVEPKPIHLIVAACRNRGIGKNGDMAWHLPNEFQYCLNTITTVQTPGKKNLVIWGRKTSEQFKGDYMPLRNCLVVVLSKTLSSLPMHADFICRDLEDAIQLAHGPSLSQQIETIWVLGGTKSFAGLVTALNHNQIRTIQSGSSYKLMEAEYYLRLDDIREAMKHPLCSRIYFTDVMAHFNCDVFFPELDEDIFKLVEESSDIPSEIQEENGIKYRFRLFAKH